MRGAHLLHHPQSPLTLTLSRRQGGTRSLTFRYVTAIGLPGEPVAPLSRSGLKM